MTLSRSDVFAMHTAHYEALQLASELTSAKLRAIPGIGSGPMGLTPDAIKFGPEYRAAKRAYDNSAAILRDFAKTYCKAWPKEIRALRDARRAAKLVPA